jgi:hypothetical protein
MAVVLIKETKINGENATDFASSRTNAGNAAPMGLRYGEAGRLSPERI